MDEDQISKQIAALREEISSTPYHKGTEHYIGRLRAKIARLEDRVLSGRLKGGGGGGGYAVAKGGDATVVLVGFPSVGKSTLLNHLTEANSKTAQYPFTTLTVVPGMMTYRGAKIQVLDIPGLISGASSGRGRGREVISVVRVADLIIFLIDPAHLEQIGKIKDELTLAGIRLGQNPPQVILNKKTRGGILIKNARALKGLSPITAKGIIEELGIKNAEVVIKGQVSQEQLIDSLLANRVYLPYLLVISKADTLKENRANLIARQFPEAILISSLTSQGLDLLRENIFKKLDFKRIYLKPQDGQVDFSRPLIMKSQDTVADAARKVGQILETKKEAFVWGKSTKFPGQLVANNHILADEDIVSFR